MRMTTKEQRMKKKGQELVIIFSLIDKIVTKELAKSLLKDKGNEINSMVTDSFKRSMFKKQIYNQFEDISTNNYSLRKDY